jgi:hypothetical protein
MTRLRPIVGGLAALVFAALLGSAVFGAVSVDRSEVRLKFTATQTKTNNAVPAGPAFSPAIEKLLQFTNGSSGANKYDVLFVDKRTLAASTGEDLDLAGSALQSAFGTNIAIANVVGVIVIAEPTNGDAIVVGNAAANGWFGMFGAAAHKVNVRPGGVFIDIAPDATGLGAVTAGTGDLLHFLNADSGAVATYTVVLLGRST